MQICPKCGHTIEADTSGYISPSIVAGILRGAGGAEKIGENLAAGLAQCEVGSQKHAQMHNTMRGWVSDADKVQQNDRIFNELNDRDKDALLMEHALRRLAEDSDWA